MKLFDLEKYTGLVHDVLNALNVRKGAKMAWTTYATDNKISNSFGTVLVRIGLVEKIKNGEYRSNLSVPYITRKQAVSIATVLKNHDLMRYPNNATIIALAKDDVIKLGVVRYGERVETRGRKAKIVQPAPIMKPLEQLVQPTQPVQPIMPVSVTKPVMPVAVSGASDLRNYTTESLLQEIGKRIAR